MERCARCERVSVRDDGSSLDAFTDNVNDMHSLRAFFLLFWCSVRLLVSHNGNYTAQPMHRRRFREPEPLS